MRNKGQLRMTCCFLTPSKIKINNNKVTFGYTTNSFANKEKYYKGTINAIKKERLWTITSSKQMEIPNSIALKELFERVKKQDDQIEKR